MYFGPSGFSGSGIGVEAYEQYLSSESIVGMLSAVAAKTAKTVE